MRNFLSVHDAKDIQALLSDARRYKQNPYVDNALGRNKTLGLIFMNPSLRTRMSAQKAAANLGMNVMVMNFSGEGWALETEEGVVMSGDKAEHIKEAAAVLGEYCDVLGLRSFPTLQDKEKDYNDAVLNAFVKYAGIPVVNLESAIRHPLQSLADVMTVEELKQKDKPKVVLTWAPHVKALPQSVPNSFAEWINELDYEFVIANPVSFDLDVGFTGNARVVHDQEEAFKDADFIYAKNWSSVKDYGKIGVDHRDWLIDQPKMDKTNQAKFMHCLPVRRNVVVSDDVLDGSHAAVIHEASNRVWAAQSVLKHILNAL